MIKKECETLYTWYNHGNLLFFSVPVHKLVIMQLLQS